MGKIDVEKLKEDYPSLSYNTETNEIIGELEIKDNCNDVLIADSFKIKIVLNGGVPSVYELSQKISRKYPHQFSKDKSLCLATDIEQAIFLENHSINEWIQKYVEKYFVSYVYYQRFGVYPFGEHSHGDLGRYEFIFDFLGVKDYSLRTKKMYEYILLKEYRGHDLCPCGSGKKVRNCHGNIIKEIKNDEKLNVVRKVVSDLYEK